MVTKKIGILGLGNVGQGVLHSLQQASSLIMRRASLKVQIAKVCDIKEEKQKIARKYNLPFTTDPYELINDPSIDIIVALVGGIEPERTHIIDALKKGKDIVTANKALLAEHGRYLFDLARKQNRTIGFEASVCGAIPLIRSISEGLVSCEVKELYGIVNGTTNYILDRMEEEKRNFAVVLAEAQAKGFAEKNPRFDIDGIDALHKLCILSYLCFGLWPAFKSVYTEGISRISLLDILYAQELGYRIKLLAIAKKNKSSLDLRVHPTLIPLDHPLSQVSLSYNAVLLDTYPAEDLLFYGKGAGGIPTSSAVISDIVNIALNKMSLFRKEENVKVKNICDLELRYYIRCMVHDEPGVLAHIARILSSHKISIASVHQKERWRGKFVPIVMITHEVKEENMQKAISLIDKLEVVKAPSQIIRIEDL